MDYLQAGADVITTATYQSHLPGFVNLGISEKDGMSLMQKAIVLADSARRRAVKPHSKIALSLGCYGASLANGSEYTGDYSGASDQAIFKFHQDRLAILLGNSSCIPDFLAFETIPNIQEARVISRLLRTEGIISSIPAWVAFACNSTSTLNSNEKLEDALSPLFEAGVNVWGVGVNCTSPHLVSGLLDACKTHKGFANHTLVAYPNSGEEYDAVSKQWKRRGCLDSEIDSYVAQAKEWMIKDNECLVGGCCRTTPAHIRALSSL